MKDFFISIHNTDEYTIVVNVNKAKDGFEVYALGPFEEGFWITGFGGQIEKRAKSASQNPTFCIQLPKSEYVYNSTEYYNDCIQNISQFSSEFW